MYHRNWLCWI